MIDGTLEEWTRPWRERSAPAPGGIVLALEHPPEPWMETAPEVAQELVLPGLPAPGPGWTRIGDVPDVELRALAERVYLDCDAAVGCCGALANPIVVDEAVAQLRRTVGLWRVPLSA